MPKPIKVRRSAKSGKVKTPEKGALPWPVIVLGAVVVVSLLIGVLLGPSMYREIVRSGALNRIAGAVDAAAEKSDFAQAAKLVEPDLEYFAEFIAQETDAKRQQALQGILPAIPAEKLPDSCFAIPKQSVLFPTVVRIASSRPREWLIESSSQANPELRGVAAEALATQLPSGTAPAAEIAKLAVPLTVEQKQKEFQRLYDEQHQQFEQALVGEWTLKVAAEHRDDEGANLEDFELVGRQLSVACEQKQWTVKFFDQTWTGRFDELPKLNLTASAQAVAPALIQAPRRATLTTSRLVLSLAFASQQGFTVQARNYPKFRTDSNWNITEPKGNVVRIQNQEITLRVPSTPAGARFSSFEIKERRETSFGRIEIEASGSDGEVSIARWRLRGESGYIKFDPIALSPRQVAEAKAANEKPVPVAQNNAQPKPDMPPAEQPPAIARVIPRGQWREWLAATNPLNDVMSFHDGERFGVIGLSTSKEGQPRQPVLRVWRTNDATVAEENVAHPFVRATTFASSADGQRLVTAETLRAGRDGIQIRVWDMDETGKLSNPRPLEFPFRDVLVPASYDARQRLSLIGKNEAAYAARAIAVSPTGRWATVANGQGAVCFYDLQDAKLVEQILLVIDREQGVVNEKYWSALSHQPVFLSDNEFVAGGYVFKTDDLRHYLAMRIPELMAQLSGGEIPFPKVIAIPAQRRLFALRGNEVREVRVPFFPKPNAAAADQPMPPPVARAPQRPMPTKKVPKSAVPEKTPNEPLRNFRHESPITTATISSDGRRLATSDEQGNLKLWNLADGKLLKGTALDSGRIHHLAFVGNGERIASGHADGTLRIWTLAELADQSQGRFQFETIVPELPDASVTKLHPVSDNKRLILKSRKSGLFDIEKSEITQRDLVLPDTWTTDLKYGLKGLNVLDLKSNRQLATLKPKGKIIMHDDEEVVATALLPNGQAVVLARKNGAIESWKVSSAKLDVANTENQARVKMLVVSPDSSTLFVVPQPSGGKEELFVHRLDAKTLKELNRIPIPKTIGVPNRLAVTSDGSLCALCSASQIVIVNSATGEIVHEERDHHCHAEFTLDGKHFVSALESRRADSRSTLRIRNVADWKMVAETNSIPEVLSMAITPNGRWLFVVTRSELLKAAMPD